MNFNIKDEISNKKLIENSKQILNNAVTIPTTSLNNININKKQNQKQKKMQKIDIMDKFTNILNENNKNFYNNNQFTQAEIYFKKALNIKERLLNPNDPELAKIYDNIGSFYTDIADYKQAEIYIKKSLEIREKSIGTNNTEYATGLNNLGNVYLYTGKYDLAESNYLKTLEIRKYGSIIFKNTLKVMNNFIKS